MYGAFKIERLAGKAKNPVAAMAAEIESVVGRSSQEERYLASFVHLKAKWICFTMTMAVVTGKKMDAVREEVKDQRLVTSQEEQHL